MQTINLDQELSVWENLDLHGRLFGMGRVERRKRITHLLAYVDLINWKRALVKQLSGGMKRRLIIARALLHAPAILFLDEPTVGLDAEIRRRIWALIKNAQQDGTTIFLTTHYIEEAEFLADRVAFLNEGRIVTIDTPQNLMARIGVWAIDRMDDGNIKTVYFKSRQEADAFVMMQKGSFTVRRVNLEDFIPLAYREKGKMLNGFIAVYLREILILKRRIIKQVLSMCVSPLLYMIAFGYAVEEGARFTGHTYREFLIPGLVAMSSMTQSYAIAVEINVARFYWHIFEEFQASPVSNIAYVAGEVLAGITRGQLSVIIILGTGGLCGILALLESCFLAWSRS